MGGGAVMFHECDDCTLTIDTDDTDMYVYDEAGIHCIECHEGYTAKAQAEAGIPPHSYRVNVAYENEAYDRSNYKRTDYMEEVLDVD
jgi:recombinational DNA repair protein (RecF pathway)